MTLEKSLERQIGQMMMVGFHGTSINTHIRQMIKENHVGGIILFSRNIRNPSQLKQLTTDLQTLAQKAGYEQPLFIAIDQEGGIVNRIEKGVAVSPGNMAIGATRSKQYAKETGKVLGGELKYLGVNMDLAPVIDLAEEPENPLGTRCFGSDPRLVGTLGKAFSLGMKQQGVAPIGKHFFGYGTSSIDPHLDLPVNTSPKKILKKTVKPFRMIKKIVPGLMTAHIIIKSYDSIPATMSQEIITSFLRKSLNYEGLVLTDCLEMDAIQEKYGTKDAAQKVVQAGGDIVLISHTPEEQQKAYETIKKAVKTGRIDRKTIQKSCERIYALKKWLKTISAPQQVNFEEDKQRMRKIATEAITALTKKGIPLKKHEKILLLTPILSTSSQTPVENQQEKQPSIKEKLTDEGFTIKQITYKDDPSKLSNMKKTVKEFDKILFMSRQISENIETFLKDLSLPQKDLLVIGLGSPWQFLNLKSDNILLTYSDTKSSLHGLCSILKGETFPHGNLPIDYKEKSGNK